MIKKFIKISGTGKFLNHNTSVIPAPNRTTDFEKINLIYGENGSGKTTFAIILKSLKDNNALLSKKRALHTIVLEISLQMLGQLLPLQTGFSVYKTA